MPNNDTNLITQNMGEVWDSFSMIKHKIYDSGFSNENLGPPLCFGSGKTLFGTNAFPDISFHRFRGEEYTLVQFIQWFNNATLFIINELIINYYIYKEKG